MDERENKDLTKEEIEKEKNKPNESADSKPKKPKINIVSIVAIAIAAVAVAVTLILVLGNKGDGNGETHTHSFGEWSVAKEASCEQEGVKERYCVCGEKQIDAVYAIGHKFNVWNVTKGATCAEEGIETRTCFCGAYEHRAVEKISSHTEVIDGAVESTCVSTGLTEGKHCSVCNLVIVEQTEIPVIEHTYLDKYDSDCESCGFEREAECRHEPITIPGIAASCTESGITDGEKCSLCGEITVAQVEIPAPGHKSGQWTVDNEATCTEEGSRHLECSVCKEIIDTEKIDILPHTESAWIISKASTCTQYGSKYKKCAVCEITLNTEVIALVSHTESSWITEKEATCTTDGNKYKKCTVCNTRLQNTTIKAIGHVGGDWIIDKAATCTERGSRHKVCSVCKNNFDSQVILAKGHTMGSIVIENKVEATCQNGGGYDEVAYCTVEECGELVYQKHTNESKKSHNYVSYICTMCNNTQPGITLVYDIEDLVNIRNNLRGTYILMNDIDCEGFPITPIGTDEASAFAGVFDGQGYTISNYVAANAQYIGVFGYSTGTIRNVNVSNFDYDITSTSYDSVYAGGLVGYNAGVVEKCGSVDGDIYISLYAKRGGALICGWSSGKIKNCFAVGKVYVTQPGNSDKYAYAAGITAYNEGDIENCFVDATLYSFGQLSNWYFGIGYTNNYGEAAMITAVCESNATISNCFVMGSITGANNRIGDVCGYCYNGAVITNCYTDTNMVFASSGNTHNYASELSAASMSNRNFYSITLGWDSDIWDFTNVNLANKIYPTLKQK